MRIIEIIEWAIFGGISYVLIFGTPGKGADDPWLIPSPFLVLNSIVQFIKRKCKRIEE